MDTGKDFLNQSNYAKECGTIVVGLYIASHMTLLQVITSVKRV